MLDDIDILVTELKSLDKEAADADGDVSDDKTAGDMNRETEMGLVPQGRVSKAPPKGYFIESGLNSLIKQMTKGKDTVDNESFRKAMAGGYEEAWRSRFFEYRPYRKLIGLWKTPYGREYLHEFALKERAAIVGRNMDILW